MLMTMTMAMTMMMVMLMLIWWWCQPGVVWRGAVPELTRLPLVHLEPLIVWKLTCRCHHDLSITFQIFSSLLDWWQKFYFLPFPNITLGWPLWLWPQQMAYISNILLYILNWYQLTLGCPTWLWARLFLPPMSFWPTNDILCDIYILYVHILQIYWHTQNMTTVIILRY